MRVIIDAEPENFISAIVVAKHEILRAKEHHDARDPIVWSADGQKSFATKWNAKSLKVWELSE